MRASFTLLALFLAVLYVLMASNAVEFQKKTLEETGLVERVAVKPVFHGDRLSAYLKSRPDALKKLAAKWTQGANP